MKSLAADPEYEQMKAPFRDDMLKHLSHGDGDLLRQKADRIAREFASIQTATFEC